MRILHTPGMYDHLARRSIADVVAEMRHLSEHGVKHIWLNDDLFIVGSNQGLARVREFCAALRRANLNMSFRPMARVDSFRKDLGIVDELIAASTEPYLSCGSNQETTRTCSACRRMQRRRTISGSSSSSTRRMYSSRSAS